MKDLNYDYQILEDREFEGQEFISCSFIETSLIKCRFIDCKFTRCRISAIKPTNSIFIDVSFIGSKVEGVDWTNAELVRGLNFTDCVLNYSNFNALKLPRLRLTNCEAKEATFSESDLENSDFSGSDFEGSIFFKTNLKKANFAGAKNYWIDIMNNKLAGAKFSLPEAIDLLRPLKIKVV